VVVDEPGQIELKGVGLQLILKGNDHHVGLVITVLLEIGH